ncbi:zinc dependent phospholipase C family protein [Planococcus sp. CPCC 101016]|uniref:zinc dependent phospholipase C family protein n=1 Tax=Planococcus sp. CPCC 101016 TaxID=2599617 RepID=UPI0011B3D18B|nr:zinc dependent phospholipase C family protein [Planococcus sp. CPCC 101016]TWT08012.1 zinc dependent phospholipase C family protein [Planococcus sp. CPCC 101016]
MGSRIMHLIIAAKVSKKLNVKNKAWFLVGGIAPDAAFTVKKKAKSHFYEGSLDDGTRTSNYKQFIEKYPFEVQSDFGLGYLTHLIADDVWLKEVYFKNDFKNRLNTDPDLLVRWHDDFKKLNKILIDWFDCGNLKKELIESAYTSLTIKEIQAKDLKLFKEEVIEDFAFAENELVSELQVYTVPQILDYLNAATNKALAVCKAIDSKEDPQ